MPADIQGVVYWLQAINGTLEATLSDSIINALIDINGSIGTGNSLLEGLQTDMDDLKALLATSNGLLQDIKDNTTP